MKMTHTAFDDMKVKQHIPDGVAAFSEAEIQEMVDYDTNYAKLKEAYPNFDKFSDAVQQKLMADTQLEQHEMAELLGCSVSDLREADDFWNELAPHLRDKFFERLRAQEVGTPDLIIGDKGYDFKQSELSKVLTLDDPECVFNAIPVTQEMEVAIRKELERRMEQEGKAHLILSGYEVPMEILNETGAASLPSG